MHDNRVTKITYVDPETYQHLKRVAGSKAHQERRAKRKAQRRSRKENRK